jgi:hypothetical protein
MVHLEEGDTWPRGDLWVPAVNKLSGDIGMLLILLLRTVLALDGTNWSVELLLLLTLLLLLLILLLLLLVPTDGITEMDGSK